MTLADVIASINNDLQGVMSPDNATDIEIGNNLIIATDNCDLTDVGVFTAAAPATTYNTGVYGGGVYS